MEKQSETERWVTERESAIDRNSERIRHNNIPGILFSGMHTNQNTTALYNYNV